jgi:hypothetical protein
MSAASLVSSSFSCGHMSAPVPSGLARSPAAERSQRSVPPSMSRASEENVKQSPVKVRQLPVSSRSTAAERIIAFLRDKHPSKTAENVSAETGLGVETVQTWLDRGSAPGIVGAWALVSAYGPEFLCAAMERPPTWCSDVARELRLQQINAGIAALEAERAELAHR